MRTTKDQHTVGTPGKLRGQQTGFGGNPDLNRIEKDATPALRGKRKSQNKMFEDESQQHIGSDSATRRTNSPSTPAMVTGQSRAGGAGGEGVFKRRLTKKRKAG